MSRGREVAIVGVGATQHRKRFTGTTSLELTVGALDAALADAGLRRPDVDGVALEWPGPGGHPGDPESWSVPLGRDLSWAAQARVDCLGIRGVLHAAAAVSAGLCEVAAVGGAQTGLLGGRVGNPVPEEFTDIWGAYPVPLFGLLAARHMHEFGTTPEQLAAVAVSIRNQGYRNPEAVMFGAAPITVDDVLSSRMIASPFHLLDCCITAEGGGVVLVTSAERARDLRGGTVAILGGALRYHQVGYRNTPLYRDLAGLDLGAARATYRAADLTPDDVDVLALYDSNTFEVIRQLEALGVCAVGEGGPYVESMGIGPGSPVPVNLDGGLLSFAWNGGQHTTLRVIEAVRQLRGTAVHPVAGARVAMVANTAGACYAHFLALGEADIGT